MLRPFLENYLKFLLVAALPVAWIIANWMGGEDSSKAAFEDNQNM
jgi:hypothetical protein